MQTWNCRLYGKGTYVVLVQGGLGKTAISSAIV